MLVSLNSNNIMVYLKDTFLLQKKRYDAVNEL